MNPIEIAYFDNCELVMEYERSQKPLIETSEGEPAMLFHEFIFCLGRIANDCIHTSDAI